ncbi:MAG: zf-HC2 domain-containing protein [Candidatus Zixiibacteriota bacterium]
MGKSCRDYINGLSDYVDGEVEPELCAEIEKHIGECQNCRIMIDSLKQTVTLCRDGRSERLPESLENKLSSLLKDRWNKKFPKEK